MSDVKKKIKKIGRHVWEMFKDALPSIFMYACAGWVLLVVALKNEKWEWDTSSITWSIACAVVALAYTGLLMWGIGGQHYEMLVSGNIKRTAADANGMSYKISSHKEAKEYREWKGFAIGGFLAIIPIVAAIVFGINQKAIDGNQLNGGALSIVILIVFFLSGWTIMAGCFFT